ncbi:hypothetical protein CHLRE_07g346525v5 [Chlamydomonas reinhardtii]|uniref:Uncharacterized protein n=1 Tax=Chlamydomonas reinhardtii TaxID=3055 RepID=A0A2K3DKZ5_CHLRE|nr:uncharacterized protein CHLRE_07g346525v5 [Chlamydomonas reinhardtii]PNW81205.1 hypothetical protein CHLRE_07g346525v5 [Chlamydomonas reinhardtii]
MSISVLSAAPYDEIRVSTGAELVAALAKQTGPSRILLSSDVVTLSNRLFTTYPTPLIVRWNVTVAGRQDRWPILDLGYVQGRAGVLLAKDVWFGLEDVLLVNFTDGRNAGSGVQLFAPLRGGGEQAVQAQVRGATVDPYCFPHATTK